MTFCLGIKVKDGLVAFADSRVTTGSECITAKKIRTYGDEDWAMFVMASGLRSVRDKAVAYFEEAISELEQPLSRMFKMVNLFGDQIRRVAIEDKQALATSGFQFNTHALVGGQMPGDDEHHLYLVYPEGNWVEIGEETPYHIIGASGYGKPVLDRTLKFDDSMRYAAKVGALAFDSTRISAADVDYPLDVAMCAKNTFTITAEQYQKGDLLEMSNWWQDNLRNSVRSLSIDQFDSLLKKLPPASVPVTAREGT
jgi:putative proteasome-type protease